MRRSVRKHYRKLLIFVELANLGWAELRRYNSFPLVSELKPDGSHRRLLQRIERALDRRFGFVALPGPVPPLDFQDWKKYPARVWRQLHAYALVRRVFDSLNFLVNARANERRGACHVGLSLQTEPAGDGTVLRVHDPYEDFLAALEGHDLGRLRSCPVCSHFFVALRSDQEACTPRCANYRRVSRFRQKQDEYRSNRAFRKRTGLSAVRHGGHRLLRLHQALQDADLPPPPAKFPE